MRRISRRAGLVACIGVAVLLASSCSSGGGTVADAEVSPTVGSSNSSVADPAADLATSAKGEGSLVVYTSAAEAAARAQGKAFTDKYGVKVQIVRMTGSQLTTRVAAEANAGGVNADVVVASDPTFMAQSVNSGTFISLDKAGLPGYPGEFPAKFLRPDLGSAVVLIEAAGIVYNTDLVKGDDVPKTWTDLLKPQWKGKIAVSDPTSSLGYIAEYQVLEKKLGSDYLTRLGSQDLKVYAASAPSIAAVAAGETPISALQLVANTAAAKAKGAPIGVVVPDFTTGLESTIGIVAKAQHPNAAKLFATYALSKDGAAVLADSGNAISPYDTSGLPSEWTPLDYSKTQEAKSGIIAKLQLG